MTARFSIGLGLAFLVNGACAQVLGLKDAELDPLHASSNSGGSGSEGSLCQTYCTTVMDSCQTTFQQYATIDVCLSVCAKLPPGSPGDSLTNTINCRLNEATLAKKTGEPQTHCPAAGPGGDGLCGSNCEGYCLLFQKACGVTFDSMFDGLGQCKTSCDQLPTAGKFNKSLQDGNTVECRLYHSSAATLDPSAHCSHAAGKAPCVNPTTGAGGSGGS